MNRLYFYSRMITGLLVACFCRTASAQNDFCLELARRELFDTYIGTSYSSNYTESRTELCRKYQRSIQNQNTLSIPGILDNSNANRVNMAELMCNNTFDLKSALATTGFLRRVLSDNATNLLQACLPKDDGVKINGSIIDDDHISLSVIYKSPSGANDSREFTDGIALDQNVECYGGPLRNVHKGTVLTNSAVGMTCRRKSTPAEQSVGPYGPYTIYNGGIVSVFTSAGQYDMRFPAKVRGPACDPQPSILKPVRLVNLCIGCLNYGQVITDTAAASGAGDALRWVEYETNLDSCGDYKLEVEYTAVSSRPARILIDGTLKTENGLANTTGTWLETGVRPFDELYLPLRAGGHIIRIERYGPFPHIKAPRLVPLWQGTNSGH